MAGVVVLLQWTDVIAKVKNGNEKAFEITMKKMNGTYEYQFSETNVVHFLFSLLRIKGLYMF
jgi:hypothetical protein